METSGGIDMSCDVCRGTNSSRCPVCGDEPDIVTCPKCRGLGLVNCYARSLRSGEEIEVTAETYLGIPATEEEARASGRHYYRSFAEDCEFCGGSGEVLLNSDGCYERAI